MPTYDNFTSWFFDASTTKVVWEPELQHQLGWTDVEVVRLSGAPARSELHVAQFNLADEQPTRHGTVIRFTVENELVLEEPMIRDALVVQHETMLSSALHNRVFYLRPEFRGLKLGPRSCAIEIYQARALGFDFIDVWAVGNAAHSRNRKDRYAMNGFAVWPRLGFDGLIPPATLAKMPEQWNSNKLTRISHLMAFHKGVEFWDEYGDECRLRFELSNITCWNSLNSYLQAHHIVVTI